MTGAPQGSRAAQPVAGRLGLVLGVLSFFFPLIAVLLVRPFGALPVVAGLLVVLLLRFVFGLGRGMPAAATWAALAVALLMAGIAAFDADIAMRLYPALMNGAMLIAFGMTLVRPPSMIERFARMMEPELPESGVRYTRAVTWVWCGFFVLNGAAAVWTAFQASLETWALYNGLIAYLLMGALFGGEFLVRGFFRKQAQ